MVGGWAPRVTSSLNPQADPPATPRMVWPMRIATLRPHYLSCPSLTAELSRPHNQHGPLCLSRADVKAPQKQSTRHMVHTHTQCPCLCTCACTASQSQQLCALWIMHVKESATYIATC